jgi:hypothetical protein
VALLGNDWAAWIGDSVPASLTNDLGLFKRNLESFNSCFGENDGVVCDGAYNQLQTANPNTGEPWVKSTLVSKHVATRDRPLSAEQVEENKIIEDARRTSL